MNQSGRLLVTGASGQLGQLTLRALVDAGQTDLIATTRQPEKVNALGFAGVTVRSADFNDPSGLPRAFEGATRLLLISTPDIGASRVEQHKNVVSAAKTAGVKHIVYTSCTNPESSPAIVAPDHAATEKFIKESGLKYTFLRMNCYAQFLMFSLPAAVKSGKLVGCAGTGKIAYINREDCAKAAAGALINASRFENIHLDVSGPDAYSHDDIASLISKITRKQVVYQDLSPDNYQAELVKTGLPELYASCLRALISPSSKGTRRPLLTRLKGCMGNHRCGFRSF